jgi:hypothetical protein
VIDGVTDGDLANHDTYGFLYVERWMMKSIKYP